MEFIAHYDEETNYIGYTFQGELLPEIDVAKELVDDETILTLVEDCLIFNTLDGEVEYRIVGYNRHSRSDGDYVAQLKEDRRD